jgi:hypothetical protein
LDIHCAFLAFSLALENTGKRMAARMAMIAMTTSNSIKVKPLLLINILFNTSFYFLFCPLSLFPGFPAREERGQELLPPF